jgi:4-hydroxythreonine-4-phosphate dehydrogenase
MREIFEKLTPTSVSEKISLLNDFLRRLGVVQPRIGVAALNPHGGEHGIFGKEEQLVIAPAVHAASQQGVQAEGPIPADTLFLRAVREEFDGVVAMYHDQGHIPIKLLGMHRAVNVTVGLPIIRTSVAHGTAFDIAWQGRANPESMIEAICVAAQLAKSPPT